MADKLDPWLARLSLAEVTSLFAQRGCSTVLIKRLAARQDNDKNQVYVGTDLSSVAKIPSGAVVASTTASRKPGARGKTKFQAKVDLNWLTPTGYSPAPKAKLIYYPQYPEVRLSGFLSGSGGAPRTLLSRAKRGQEAGRVLLLGSTDSDASVWGLALPPESATAKELLATCQDTYGVFRLWILEREPVGTPRKELLDELARISRMGWLAAVRLLPSGDMVACTGTNCGGYTLEAHLGVVPNGLAEPDYVGWEIKQHAVTSLAAPQSGVITLFTPEPDGGVYELHGVRAFVFENGYPNGSERWDFTGRHFVGSAPLDRTGTRLTLSGYRSPRDFDADGAVVLTGRNGETAASWSFAKLMSHWKRKHAAACYVASVRRSKGASSQYAYASDVLLAEGATFAHLLDALERGLVYYDPGINLKRRPDGSWKAKKRSQFRVRFTNVPALYSTAESVNCLDAENSW